MTTATSESELDAAQDRVSRPLGRLTRRYGVDEWQWLALGLVTSALAYGTVLVTPLVLGTTIDALFTGESAYGLPLVPAAWLPTEPTAQFWLSAAIVGAALGGGAVLQWVRGVAMNYFAHGVMYAIRVDAYEKMQRLDMTFFDNKETGEIMSILNNDTSNLEIFFDNALGDSVRIGVIVVGVTAALLYTNAQLALVTLGAVPLLVGFTWWFVRVIEPRYADHRSVIGDLNTRIENGLSGIELVKTASTEAYENERVRGVSRDVFDTQIDVLKLSYFYRPGMELLTGAALLATFVIGGLWVFSGPPLFFSGNLTTGEFVVFMLLTQRLTGPMAQLSNIVDWYENAKASGKRICGLQDVPVHIEDGPEAVELDSVEGHIEFDDVRFSYESGPAVLDGVDFTVEPGETVALVGATGASKSTVAKLLLRLYDTASTYDVSYLEPVLDEHFREEDGERYLDRDIASERGSTPVDGLYLAGPTAGVDSQVAISVGHGAKVGLEVVTDYRTDQEGWWPAAADHTDWVVEQGRYAGEEWVEKVTEYHVDTAPDDIDDSVVERRARELARQQREWQIDGEEVERRTERAYRRLLEHIDDELILERAETIGREQRPSGASD